MENYKIRGKQVLLDSGVIAPAEIVIKEEKFTEISEIIGEAYEKSVDDDAFINLDNYILLPGLIDIHTHGCAGKDIMDKSSESVNIFSCEKIKEGVTSFCPTTVTESIAAIKEAILAAKEAFDKGLCGADIIGVFIEGPYINPKYKGAHDDKLIRNIDLGEIKEIIETAPGFINSFAIAPELSSAKEAISFLVSNGVNVRVGHSDASYVETIAAADNGVNMTIHSYNAMRPIHHREAGILGATIIDDRIYAELICDFIHVSPAAIKILYKAKGADKIILITDSMSASCMPDGKYKLGGLDVYVENGAARTMDGALAGSTLRLIDGVKNMCALGIPFIESVKMATENPARAVGVFDISGSISVGKKADIIAIDDNYDIKFVMRRGKILLDKTKAGAR